MNVHLRLPQAVYLKYGDVFTIELEHLVSHQLEALKCTPLSSLLFLTEAGHSVHHMKEENRSYKTNIESAPSDLPY